MEIAFVVEVSVRNLFLSLPLDDQYAHAKELFDRK